MIPLFKVHSAPDIIEKLKPVFSSGFIGQGPKVEEFEKLLSVYLNNKLVLTTNSATSAEHLAIHLLKKSCKSFIRGYNYIAESDWPGINENDEVLLCPLTCFATTAPILANGLKPKWVDVDLNTCSISLEDLNNKITETTKIVIPIHWGGTPIDLDKLHDIIVNHISNIGFKAAVIEDCAHAFGAKYKGQFLGNHGNICTYSFQAIKHLTTGDGGLITLPHKNLYDRAKLLRWYGIDRTGPRTDFRCELDISEYGFKFHMNDIAATIGLSNMEYINSVLSIHKRNARYYNNNLSNIDGIQLLPFNEESSYWLYTLRAKNRDDLIKHLASHEITASRVHERNDKHSCVSQYKTELPNLDILVKEMLCIPVGWWVSHEDREYIVDIIKKGW